MPLAQFALLGRATRCWLSPLDSPREEPTKSDTSVRVAASRSDATANDRRSSGCEFPYDHTNRGTFMKDVGGPTAEYPRGYRRPLTSRLVPTTRIRFGDLHAVSMTCIAVRECGILQIVGRGMSI